MKTKAKIRIHHPDHFLYITAEISSAGYCGQTLDFKSILIEFTFFNDLVDNFTSKLQVAQT